MLLCFVLHGRDGRDCVQRTTPQVLDEVAWSHCEGVDVQGGAHEICARKKKSGVIGRRRKDMISFLLLSLSFSPSTLSSLVHDVQIYDGGVVTITIGQAKMCLNYDISYDAYVLERTVS